MRAEGDVLCVCAEVVRESGRPVQTHFHGLAQQRNFNVFDSDVCSTKVIWLCFITNNTALHDALYLNLSWKSDLLVLRPC